MSKADEGVNQVDIWEERIPGWGNFKCRVPEAEACLECWRNNKEVSGTGRERQQWGKVKEMRMETQYFGVGFEKSGK